MWCMENCTTGSQFEFTTASLTAHTAAQPQPMGNNLAVGDQGMVVIVVYQNALDYVALF